MGNWFVLSALSIAVGFIGGYAGIGGAPILVAAMVMCLGFDQHLAQGTVLAVMLGPMSLAGVVVMWDRVRLLLRPIIAGVAAYAVCSNLGARIAFAMASQPLEALFGVLLVGLGAHYIWRSRNLESPTLTAAKPAVTTSLIPFNSWTVCAASGVIGVAGGLFGIGAGVLLVPVLVSLFGLHKDDARSLSLAILLPPVSIGAVIEYQHHGKIDWPAAALIFAAYFATNYFGAKVGRKHSPRRFLRALGALLLLLGVIMVGTFVLQR